MFSTSQVSFQIETRLLKLIHEIGQKEAQNKGVMFHEALAEWLIGRAHLSGLNEAQIGELQKSINAYRLRRRRYRWQRNDFPDVRMMQVNFEVEAELLRLISQVAHREGRKKSEIFREALVEWLERRAYLDAFPKGGIGLFIT